MAILNNCATCGREWLAEKVCWMTNGQFFLAFCPLSETDRSPSPCVDQYIKSLRDANPDAVVRPLTDADVAEKMGAFMEDMELAKWEVEEQRRRREAGEPPL